MSTVGRHVLYTHLCPDRVDGWLRGVGCGRVLNNALLVSAAVRPGVERLRHEEGVVRRIHVLDRCHGLIEQRSVGHLRHFVKRCRVILLGR